MLSPKAIILLTRTLLRDKRARRTMMFYVALAAILMVFAGSVLIEAMLRTRPFIFLGYWAVCAWLTIAAMLLAIFDLLAVRAAGRSARRNIERNFLAHDDDPHAR